MLESEPDKFVYYCIGNGDPAFPCGPAITILDPRTTPAETDLAIGITEFLLQIPPPYFTAMVVGD